jgi:hypothetical protein
MAFALLIAVIVLRVVPPAVWWAVTQVVPRVLGEIGLSEGTRSAQEARLQRIEEAIDAIALKVDQLARQQALAAGAQERIPVERVERAEDPDRGTF